MQAAVDVAVATGEPLRVVVSSAGIGWASRTVGRDGSPHDLATYRKVIDVNLIGTFNLMRIGAAAIAKTEPADADGQRGVVINTASVAGIEGQTGQVAYSASKGGIIGMTVPAARDLAAIGVRVQHDLPGHHRHARSTDQGRRARSSRPSSSRRWPSPSGWAGRPSSRTWCAPLIENDYMNAEVDPLRRRYPLPAQVSVANRR